MERKMSKKLLEWKGNKEKIPFFAENEAKYDVIAEVHYLELQ